MQDFSYIHHFESHFGSSNGFKQISHRLDSRLLYFGTNVCVLLATDLRTVLELISYMDITGIVLQKVSRSSNP